MTKKHIILGVAAVLLLSLTVVFAISGNGNKGVGTSACGPAGSWCSLANETTDCCAPKTKDDCGCGKDCKCCDGCKDGTCTCEDCKCSDCCKPAVTACCCGDDCKCCGGCKDGTCTCEDCKCCCCCEK